MVIILGGYAEINRGLREYSPPPQMRFLGMYHLVTNAGATYLPNLYIND